MTTDPFTELGTQLRIVAGQEMIDEWEVTEAETEQGRRRQRTLINQWEQVMHRGDAVHVMAPFGHLFGTVDYVGTDYATVVTTDLCWDLRVGRCVMTPRRSPSGGHIVRGGSRTFKARLAEYESTGEPVTALLPDLGLEIHGQIDVVATDHLVLIDSHPRTVPLLAIAAIKREL